MPWENPVQWRETKVPKPGSHLHTATPEPFNTTSSPKTRINVMKTGGARHPDKARGAFAIDRETGRHWVAQETEGKYV